MDGIVEVDEVLTRSGDNDDGTNASVVERASSPREATAPK